MLSLSYTLPVVSHNVNAVLLLPRTKRRGCNLSFFAKLYTMYTLWHLLSIPRKRQCCKIKFLILRNKTGQQSLFFCPSLWHLHSSMNSNQFHQLTIFVYSLVSTRCWLSYCSASLPWVLSGVLISSSILKRNWYSSKASRGHDSVSRRYPHMWLDWMATSFPSEWQMNQTSFCL